MKGGRSLPCRSWYGSLKQTRISSVTMTDHHSAARSWKGSPAGTRSFPRADVRSCPSTSRATSPTSRACTWSSWITAWRQSFPPRWRSFRTRRFAHSFALTRIADVFWRETLIDAAVFREWVVNVGRRDAYARIAHVLCEIYVRLRAVGLVSGQAYQLPITQAELADATGLSTVDVNRTLQELRGNGLITMKGGRVVIEDWSGLQTAGEFDPTYLHIKKQAA